MFFSAGYMICFSILTKKHRKNDILPSFFVFWPVRGVFFKRGPQNWWITSYFGPTEPKINHTVQSVSMSYSHTPLRPMDPSASQFTETPFRPADSLGKIRFSLSQWLVSQKTYPKMQNRSSTLGLGEMMIDSPPLGAK